MNPIDYRNATWTELQGRITRDRQAALDAWVKYGPGTTRAVATAAGIDLLTFRPRTTELFQLGYLDCVEAVGHEGTYRALTTKEVLAEFERRIKSARTGQGEMRLGV